MKKLVSVFAFLAAVLFAGSAYAAEGVHKIAVHVDQNDPAIMNLALNNVENVKKYYEGKGEKVVIEIVAYGPGLNMLIADKSPVKERIATMSLEDPELQFSACGNTLAKMVKKAGKDIALLSEATMVESGVVRLTELQEQGYTYVKP
ncbi:MAG: DsrE family protein [Salaquimonas sp.]|jgi:hypothetical protein|nr:DsrE family protein [Salaquimonas sp.]